MRALLRRQSPFLWIAVTPVVTVPLSALLIYTLGGEHDPNVLGLPAGEYCAYTGPAEQCFYYYELWRTLLLFTIPGLPILGVLAWFGARSTYMRWAAGAAGVLAVVRLFLPVVAIVISQFALVDEAGELYLRVEAGEGERPTNQLLFAAWTVGFGAWVLSLVAWWAFEPVMARLRPEMPPPEGHQRRGLWSRSST